MKTIFVNRYYRPDASPTSLLLADLAESLASSGAEVHVITSRQLYGNARAALPPSETLSGVRVRRVWTTSFGRGNLWGRLADYLTYYATAALEIWKTARRGDTVVAKTDPPMLSVAAWLAAAVRGAHLVNWLQDLFPDIAAAVGVAPYGALWLRPLRAVRDGSLRAAALNVAIDDGMARVIQGRGVAPERIAVIPNWADGRRLAPVDRASNPLRAGWRIETKTFVVGYSGNLGRIYEFGAMLNAARILRDDPNILFIFVGDGAQKRRIERQCRTMGLTNVTWKPLQPASHLSESLSLPDVHIIPLNPAVSGLASPSKFYSILAVGRPVLYSGDPVGTIARVLGTAHCGYVVSARDAEALAGHIRALKLDPALCRVMGENGRRAFEKEFDRPHALQHWRRALERAAGDTVRDR